MRLKDNFKNGLLFEHSLSKLLKYLIAVHQILIGSFISCFLEGLSLLYNSFLLDGGLLNSYGSYWSICAFLGLLISFFTVLKNSP